MTAFDQAWALVKMPIVPHSLRQVGEKRKNWPLEYEAQFIDPVSGEELLMTSTEDPKLKILPMWELGITDKEGYERASALMDSRHYGTFQSERSRTKEPYRRRGYMTALYDMAARLAADEPNDEDEGGWRLRQGLEEEDGMGDLLWEKQGVFWLIRDDLYEVGE